MRKKVCGASQSTHAGGGPAVYHVRPLQSYSHSSAKKEKELHICPKCNSSFLHPRHLNRHLQGHKRNDCQYCNELFTSRKKLVSHMREKHGKKLLDSKYSCKFCEKSFTRRDTLHSHYRTHAEGRLVCEVCGEFFSDKAELENHKKVHEDSRLCCLLCHQTFSRQQQYTRHMQSHDKYQCLTCRRGFSAWKVLLQHQQEGHDVILPIARNVCSFCNKAFSRRTSLQAHLKRHLPGKTFDCQVCSKKYPTSRGLAMHVTTESHLALASEVTAGEQGFVCESCGKHFLHQQSLDIHRMRNHAGKRVYCCDFCTHSTNFKANLTRHIRLHLNERRFVCEQCGAAFYVLSALKDHCVYLHSDVRQHRCDECHKTFKRSSELKRHLKTHSDDRPHSCSSCDRSFKRSFHLRRHREKFHNEVKISRQVQRLRQDDTGTFQPVPKEIKISKKKQLEQLENAQILMLPYEDIVSLKQLSEDGTCKDVSTLSLSCSQDLSTVPAAHYLVTLPTQNFPTSEANLIYLAAASIQAMSNESHESQQESEICKVLTLREGEGLDLLKHRHYQSTGDLSSHMLLAPHEAALRNVLGADVKLSDSMMEDVAEPRQPSPGRDSPLCMADLVRLQDSTLHDFRNHDIQRDGMNSPMSTDLSADHLYS